MWLNLYFIPILIRVCLVVLRRGLMPGLPAG